MQVRTIALCSVGLIVAGLWLRGCDDTTLTPPGNHQPALAKPLGPEDQLHISYGRDRIVVQTRTETKTAYVPPSGRTDVTVRNDGTVSVNIKNKGLTLEPGFGGMLSDQSYFVVDAQVLYWNRFSAGPGIGITPHARVVGLANAAYRLDQLRLPNTSLFVAVTHEKNVGVGIRVRF